MILSEYGTQIFAVMVGYGHFFSSEMSFCTKQWQDNTQRVAYQSMDCMKLNCIFPSLLPC